MCTIRKAAWGRNQTGWILLTVADKSQACLLHHKTRTVCNHLVGIVVMTMPRGRTFLNPNGPRFLETDPYSRKCDRLFDKLAATPIEIWIWFRTWRWHQTTSHQRAFSYNDYREEQDTYRGRATSRNIWASNKQRTKSTSYIRHNRCLKWSRHTGKSPRRWGQRHWEGRNIFNTLGVFAASSHYYHFPASRGSCEPSVCRVHHL